MVSVEVVYVDEHQQVFHRQLTLEEGATAGEALSRSGLYETHPDAQALPVGIFSKRITLSTRLTSGSRLEVYRPLTDDPKLKRRDRAKRVNSAKRA